MSAKDFLDAYAMLSPEDKKQAARDQQAYGRCFIRILPDGSVELRPAYLIVSDIKSPCEAMLSPSPDGDER